MTEWRGTLLRLDQEPKYGAGRRTGLPDREKALEMARRHVREGEARVYRQRELVANLSSEDELSRAAKRLLAEFERTLRDHQTMVDRLEREAAA